MEKAGAASVTWTWVALMLLTLMGAIFSETALVPAGWGAGVLLLLAGFKFSGIASVYMELGHAHPGWRWGLRLLLVLLLGGCLAGYHLAPHLA